MTTEIIQIAWNDTHSRYKEHIIGPDTTSVKAVKKASQTRLDDHAEHVACERELAAARAESQRFNDQARGEAMEAGRIGKKADKNSIKKRRAAVADRLEDAELDFAASAANMDRGRTDYLAVLAHHAPALAAEARQEAEGAMMGFASALSIARKARATFEAATGLLAALPAVVAGDVLNPMAPDARREKGDSPMEGTSPIVYAEIGIDGLQTAIGWADRVLRDLAADEKQRERDAKLAAEVDAAPDLDDSDEDEDDEDAG